VSTDGRCIHEMLPGQCSICLGHPDDALYAAAAMGEHGHRPIGVGGAADEDDWRGYCVPGCPDDVCRSMRHCAWPVER
jgi:hypothetical protein